MAGIAGRFALGAATRGEAAQVVFVPYEVAASSSVALTILDDRRRPVGALVDRIVAPGRYVAAADVGSFSKGRYTLVLAAGTYRAERSFLVE
jgi:hypothetical protein